MKASRQQKILDSMHWDIGLGSIVKVKNFDLYGQQKYEQGIVISDKQVCQIELFPFVNVYVLSSAKTIRCHPGIIEIISNSNHS